MGVVAPADSGYVHVDAVKTADRMRMRRPLFSIVVGGADAKVGHTPSSSCLRHLHCEELACV